MLQSPNTSFDPSARPLRVLFLAHYFPKPTNPLLGTWALEQAQAISRQGVDLRVLSFNSWIPRPLAAVSKGARAYACCPEEHRWGSLNVRYPRWAYYPIGPLKRWARRTPQRQLRLAWLTAAGTLADCVRDFKPDVVYAHHSLPNGYLALRLRERFGTPYVVTDHSETDMKDMAASPDRARAFRDVAAGAACMVSVSARLEAAARALAPGARTRTVYNGTNLPDPALALTPRPAELAGRTVILSVGLFYPRKGFPLLVEAFARVAAKHPDAVLRIVGDGEDRPAVERAVRESGLGSRVHLLGALPHGQVLQEMAWCDLFALVSWDEPWGVVFSEAMAAGKPVVCANEGGINDVVRDRVHGRTVPPRDVDAAAGALDELLTDPAARVRMGREARRTIESDLTWDANAATMVGLFREAATAAMSR